MASLINPGKIDVTFPIAGQDNDTQGFRTNYQNIKNNFTVAASEITALQANVTLLQTENITGNITVSGNIITANITSPAGTGGNIIINPDGTGDVIFPLTTEVYIQSGASSVDPYHGALVITGGIGISGNINSGGNIFLSNTITVGNGVYSSGSFTGSYSDGVVVDYAPGNGRISVGAGDVLTFYAGGPANTQTMSIASNAVVSLTSAIQFANLTTTQINTISTPARGMTVYNYTTGNIQVYNGTKWANVTLS